MPGPDVAAAALAAATGRAKAAQHQARSAVQHLARAQAGFRPVDVVRVAKPRDADYVRERLLVALHEHTELDVVVLATNPPRPPDGGEGEQP